VLVLDEADLLLSYGYEEDVRALAPHVPRSAQVGGAAAHAATQRRPVAAHGCFQQAGQRRQWLVELLPRAAALCLPCLAKAALRRRLHDVLCNWPLLWLQCMLMSATSSEEVDRLTQLVLHNPVALNLLGKATGEGDEVRGNTARGGEGGGRGSPGWQAGCGNRGPTANQAAVRCRSSGGLLTLHTSAPVQAAAAATAGGAAAEIEHLRVDMPPGCGGGAAAEVTEKLLHLLALLKLNLVQRKVLVFVNSADDGMRLRLFLEAFGIRAAALSADQPLNSRHHILQASGSPWHLPGLHRPGLPARWRAPGLSVRGRWRCMRLGQGSRGRPRGRAVTMDPQQPSNHTITTRTAPPRRSSTAASSTT
jgi:hypothetical protein